MRPDSGYILSADVGGTKVLLRLSALSPAGCQPVREARFHSAAHADFESMLAQFLAGAPTVAAACFGVPGPVVDNIAKLTNLPWWVDGAAISRRFNIPQVRLVNDFVAIGHGIGALAAPDLVILQPGAPRRHSACAVLGAGTGLGVGFVFPAETGVVVVPTEGGNVDFAPNSELEAELWRFLKARHGHVCVERVVSGPGLANIYAFLCEHAGQAAVLLAADDPPAAIATAAQAGTDRLAGQALDMFIRAYGAFAGNLALLSLSHGGVFVAGGIAAKLVDRLGSGGFMAGFLDKGRYRPLLETMPVSVVMNPLVGLLGAERLAAELASPRSST